MPAAMDVLGLGCIAIDHCLLVDDYPPEDAKRLVLAQRQSLGGTAGGAIAAAARYGARCGFAGRLDHDSAAFVLAEFERLGVDTRLIQHAAGILPIRCEVIVSRRTSSRTVLYDLRSAAGASEDWPPEGSISSARLLLIDHFGMEGMLRAAKIARALRVPIVADFEAHQRAEFPELLGLVDHLFVSQPVASAVTGRADPAAACRALWSPQRKVVVITTGSDGFWCLSTSEAQPTHHPVFSVPAVDTTGCGDVFRGVYAAALQAGLPLEERLTHAAAAAAIVAAHPFDDAIGRWPARAEIEAFVARQARTN